MTGDPPNFRVWAKKLTNSLTEPFANVGGWRKPRLWRLANRRRANFWPIFSPQVATGGFTPAANVSKRFIAIGPLLLFLF